MPSCVISPLLLACLKSKAEWGIQDHISLQLLLSVPFILHTQAAIAGISTPQTLPLEAIFDSSSRSTFPTREISRLTFSLSPCETFLVLSIFHVGFRLKSLADECGSS
jgi:hypothetical protein